MTDTDKALWAEYARLIAPMRGRTEAFGAAGPLAAAEPAGVGLSAQGSPASRIGVADQAGGPRGMGSPLSVGTQPGGIDGATWRRFRSGKLMAARKLDLHGMTTQRAFHALVSFVHAAHADRVRCVEIVTGRGSGETGGVIRKELPHWLNLPSVRPLVLAAAHPHALNPGSVRLILRRIR